MSKLRKSNTWREMLQTPSTVEEFNFKATRRMHKALKRMGAVNIVGLGSSVRFPANNMKHVSQHHKKAAQFNINPMGGREALDKKHKKAAVFLVSNSGETQEVADLARKLIKAGHKNVFAITANGDSTLAKLCGKKNTFVLGCGQEKAIAATKSAVEQALVMMAVLRPKAFSRKKMHALGKHLEDILNNMEIPDELVEQMAKAHGIHFAAPANGAAWELVLKFSEACARRTVTVNNETEILHGPPQGMVPRSYRRSKEKNKDVVLIMDTDKQDIEIYRKKLIEKAGLNVWALASEEMGLPTLKVPEFDDEDFRGFTQLVAGWALMIKVAEKLNLSIREVDNPDLLAKVAYGLQANAA